MRVFIRVVLIAAISLLLLSAAAVAGMGFWLGSQVTALKLAAQIESSVKGTAEVREAKLKLFGVPSSLVVSGIVIKPEVTAEEPAPAPVLELDEVVLELSLPALLTRTLDVRSLQLNGLRIREKVTPEGLSDLKTTLGKDRGGDPVAAAEKTGGMDATGSGSRDKTKVAKRERAPEFHADRLGLGIRIHEARISGASFHQHNRVNKTRTSLDDLHFALLDIDLDPNDLANHNTARLEMRARLKLEGRGKVGAEMQDVVFADLNLKGEGAMQLFDPATRLWSPVSDWEFNVAAGSRLAGYMTIDQASPDAAKKMSQYGLDLAGLPLGGELKQDAEVRLAWQDGRMLFREDARFVVEEYEIRFARGSWVNTAEDAQDFTIRLVCGEDLERRLREGVMGMPLGAALGPNLFKKLRDEETGKFAIDIKAAGQVTKPKISLPWEQLLRL